jgi:hypothetical protein
MNFLLEISMIVRRIITDANAARFSDCIPETVFTEAQNFNILIYINAYDALGEMVTVYFITK